MASSTALATIGGYIASLFEQKTSQFASILIRLGGGQPVYPDRHYRKQARFGYERNVIAAAAIKLVASGAASCPFVLFEGKGKAAKEIEDHPLLDLLHRPNKQQDGIAFAEQYHSFELIGGNSFLERVDGIGFDSKPALPVELYTIRPDYVTIIPGENGPAGFEITINGEKRRVMVDLDTGKIPVMQMKTFHPLNDWYGMSPLQPAAWSIDTHTGAGAFNKQLLDNSATPSGALRVVPDKNGDANLTPEQYTQMKADIEERYTGPKNAGKPLVLQGGLEWQQFGMTMKDMQFLELKREAAREIALSIGVPPMILGIPGDNTYSNYQEANTALWKQTILPRAERAARALSLWLCPSFGENLELRIDKDNLDALADDRATHWDRATKSAASILTINEARDGIGYEPIDGGDTILVPATLVPLDVAIQPPEPAPIVDPNADPAADPNAPPAPAPKPKPGGKKPKAPAK